MSSLLQPPYGVDPNTGDPNPPPVDTALQPQQQQPPPDWQSPSSNPPSPPPAPPHIPSLSPPPHQSALGGVLKYAPAAIGTILALTSKKGPDGYYTPGGRRQMQIGTGLAEGSLNEIQRSQHHQQEQGWAQQQALVKSVGDRIEQLRMSGGFNDPKIKGIIAAYDQAKQQGNGVIHPSHAAQIDSLLNQVPNLGDLATKSKQQDELSLYKGKEQILTEEQGKRSQQLGKLVPMPGPNGTTIMVSADKYYSSEHRKPVVFTAAGPDGKPLKKMYDFSTGQTTTIPDSAISVKQGHTVYTDPSTGVQSIVEVPTTFGTPSGGGNKGINPPPGTGASSVTPPNTKATALVSNEQKAATPGVLAEKGGGYKVPETERKALANIATARKLAQEVKTILGPDAAKGGWYEDTKSMMQNRGQGLLYREGIRPTDPINKKMMALANQMQLIASQPYAGQSRAVTWLKEIKKHLPIAGHDSNGLIADKIDNMLGNLDILEEDMKNTPVTIGEMRGKGKGKLKAPPSGGSNSNFDPDALIDEHFRAKSNP